MLKRALTASILITLLSAPVASAQVMEPTSLRPGDRVRVTVLGGVRNEGEFVSINDESLTWHPAGGSGAEAGPEAVRPVQSIYFLERYEGEQPVGMTGFALTMLAGMTVGAIWGAQEDSDWLFDQGDYAMMGAALGGLISIPFGFAVARGVKRESWAHVRVPRPQPKLQLLALPDGRAGLRVSIPTRH